MIPRTDTRFERPPWSDALIRPGTEQPALRFEKMPNKGAQFARMPQISRSLLAAFNWYSRHYLRRHFHSLRVSRMGFPPQCPGWPIVVYANHASWWDPLVFLALRAEFYPGRCAFAPMDAAMLGRYPLFRRLGFFAVEQHTSRGAVQFLESAKAVLESPRSLLAVTPQGRFADPRERPLRFAPGLGYLAVSVCAGQFVPVAIEYAFWEERLPEIFVRFGRPVEVQRSSRAGASPQFWTAAFEDKLAETQEALALEVQRRKSADFQTLFRGGAGQGGIYDWWRFLKAKLNGQPFQKEHGNK